MSTVTQETKEMVSRVKQWAREHASEDYFYGTPQSYFAVAVSCAFISQADYDDARDYFGNLWNYRGD